MPLEHSTSTVACGYGPGSKLLDVERVDAHRPRRALDLLARARELVQPAAADLQRRDHRRHLLDVADERARIAVATSASVTGIGRAFEHRARRVERVGRDAERRRVPRYVLRRLLQEAQQPRDPAEADEQHAGRVGIERARVPDPPLPVDACAASRRRRATSSPAGLSTTTSPSYVSVRPLVTRSERGADAVDRVGDRRRRDVNPAANRWPPPPCAAAMWRTSTAPTERRLTRHRAVGVLLEHARDLGLARSGARCR